MWLVVTVACVNLAIGFAIAVYCPFVMARPVGDTSSPESDDLRPHRATPRFIVEELQRIAPVQAGQSPDSADFRQVRCSDVSSSGFSFTVPEEPHYEELIAEFAMSSETTYLRARVRNRTPVGPEPESGFRVGCEFLERLDWQPA